MASRMLEILQAHMTSGEMDKDPAQLEAARRLDSLETALATWRNGRRWGFGSLFGNRTRPPKGLYIWGKVGRGKTTLMDMF